jgi:hypothetical protein
VTVADVSGLIDLADAKVSLGITTTTHDADIQRYIGAATPVIERITGPILLGSRTFTFDGGTAAIVLPVRFNTVTAITESGTTITDYFTVPSQGIIYAGTTTVPRNFVTGTRNISVTVTVGLARVPENVALAARELVRHWWQLGRQGNRPAFGNDGQLEVANGFGVPTRRVMELVSPNIDVGGFA